MQYRNLGKSNLQVSRLCLGTMMFGDQTSREEAAAIVSDAHAQGVNYIDTADVYTKGASESMLGELLRGQRHDWVLATKLGNPMSERKNEGHYSRSWMLREVEASLARLQTDHVDILYLHRDYNGMSLEEPLWALDALLRAGKIRYWGVSNFRGWRIAELVHLARQMGMPGPVVCQPYYNLLNRMPEVEILPACAHHGLGVTPYSPGGAGRAHWQVSAWTAARGGLARRAGRPAHGADRIPRRVAADRPDPAPAPARARHHTGPVCHRLGARASGREFGDNRASHAGAVAGLRASAGLHADRRRRGIGGFAGGPRSSVHARLYRSRLPAGGALGRSCGAAPALTVLQLCDGMGLRFCVRRGPVAVSAKAARRPVRYAGAPGVLRVLVFQAYTSRYGQGLAGLRSNSGMQEISLTEQRLNDLEIKASYTDDLLDQLNLTIYRQQQQIDDLARELVRLRQQAPEGGAAAARNPRDELPPHY